MNNKNHNNIKDYFKIIRLFGEMQDPILKDQAQKIIEIMENMETNKNYQKVTEGLD